MHTPFFPALRPVLAPMRSPLRATAGGLAQATLHQIEQRLAPALSAGLLEKPAKNDHSRERVFSLTRTFWFMPGVALGWYESAPSVLPTAGLPQTHERGASPRSRCLMLVILGIP